MNNQFEQSLDSDTTTALENYGPGIEIFLTADGETYSLRALFENEQLDLTAGAATAATVLFVPTLHIQSSVINALIERELKKTDIFSVKGQDYRVNYAMDDGYGIVKVTLIEDMADNLESFDGL